MDFNLSDDQKAFAESARSFADGVFKPNAAQWDAEHIFPKDALKQAGELGFMGMYTPEDAGGLGMSRLDTSVIVEELARGCTSTAAFLTIHNMATSMVGTYGKPALIEEWCGDLVMGEKLASYCLTEPSAGSDAGNLRSTARANGDNYIVNGSKMFISGAGSTDLLVVMLRTGTDGPKGISAFAIPADAPGVSYGKKEEKMGWNSQPTRTVTFEDVVVPAANILGKEGEGFKIAMKGLDGGRINIATCSIGTAQAALETTIEYVKERKQFGQAIADFQNTQFKLADMTTDLVAARQMVRLAAFKLDSGDPEASTYCAMAKRFVTDVCFTICNDALQLHGGYGYIKEYPLERHVRDSRVHQILEGTNEIMRVIIGRRLLIEGALEVIK
ncbi:acyl-CoA dehydrogenase family protein [Zhongshania sp. BJYM1]|uniref:acyl-CoA dehydrogenase family protein n=1 Tax=Zhongshania aquatica TaxID=2965069 RepID=UPI0022B5E3AA|nr:acyl-CoA dehydrogenase family protein [Marortus sp. BJYM1]